MTAFSGGNALVSRGRRDGPGSAVGVRNDRADAALHLLNAWYCDGKAVISTGDRRNDESMKVGASHGHARWERERGGPFLNPYRERARDEYTKRNEAWFKEPSGNSTNHPRALTGKVLGGSPEDDLCQPRTKSVYPNHSRESQNLTNEPNTAQMAENA